MAARDHNAFPLVAIQNCRDALQTEPIKSEPEFKPLRYLLERMIEDLRGDNE